MNELNRLYESILLAWGCKIDQSGKITCVMLGKEYPLRIDGKDLHLPISEALNSGADQKVYFHPTCESIISKETEVFKLSRRLAGIRLLSVFRSMIPVLFDISSRKEKKSWNQAVYDVISPLGVVKKSVKDEVFSMLARLSVEVEDNTDNRFIHFKITKGGKGELGERVYYKAKPSFPLYDVLVRELARSEGQPKNATISVNNFTMSREAIELTVHLFRSILPATQNPDAHEFDALVPVAARFTAFMYCFGNVAGQLNRAQNMFRGEFDKKSVYNIDVSWEEHLEEIPEFYRQVPELDYNSHNVYKEGEQQQNALGGNMSNLFNISTQQQAGVPTQHTAQTGEGEVRVINGIEFNMKVPTMWNGDRYLRSEPNLAQNRVHHYAIDMNQQTVIYVCSRMGNFLHRESMQQYGAYGAQPYAQQPYGYAPQQMPQQQLYDQYGRPVVVQQPQQQSPYATSYGHQAPSASTVSNDAIESAW
jgi:hypothetical protein